MFQTKLLLLTLIYFIWIFLFENFYDEYFRVPVPNPGTFNVSEVENFKEPVIVSTTNVSSSTLHDVSNITNTTESSLPNTSSNDISPAQGEDPVIDPSLESPLVQPLTLSEESPQNDIQSRLVQANPSSEPAENNSKEFYIDLKDDQEAYQPFPHESKGTRAHPLHQVIEDPKSSFRTRAASSNKGSKCHRATFLSRIEPSNVSEALNDPAWITAMQEKLNQFDSLKIWRLVPRSKGKAIITTKWIFNKKDEDGVVIRNKARLVANGHKQ